MLYLHVSRRCISFDRCQLLHSVSRTATHATHVRSPHTLLHTHTHSATSYPDLEVRAREAREARGPSRQTSTSRSGDALAAAAGAPRVVGQPGWVCEHTPASPVLPLERAGRGQTRGDTGDEAGQHGGHSAGDPSGCVRPRCGMILGAFDVRGQPRNDEEAGAQDSTVGCQQRPRAFCSFSARLVPASAAASQSLSSCRCRSFSAASASRCSRSRATARAAAARSVSAATCVTHTQWWPPRPV